jgi:hypothetical protein
MPGQEVSMASPFDAPDTTRTAVADRPAPPTTPRRTLWIIWIIGGAVAAAVILIGGLGTLLYSQYTAPGKAATTFCDTLKAQSYGVAYEMFSSAEQARFTHDQFVQGAQTLDQVEGTVQACALSSASGAYGYSLGASTASLATVITRARVGTLRGIVHMTHENGAWKIDGLDTSLLGVNLGALQTAGAFCAALQSQAYTTAYALLDSVAQAAVSQDAFVRAAQAHDQIDGNITACALAGLGNQNTDTQASLVVNMTRSRLGQRAGAITLDAQGGVWKIATIADTLQGTDLGPLQVGAQMCADLMSGSYAAIYDLTSQAFQAHVTRTQVVNYFTLPTGFRYAGCKVDYASYKVTGNEATYDVEIDLSDPSGTVLGFPFALYFVNENGGWKLDGILFKRGAASAGAPMGPGFLSLILPTSH